MAPRGQPDFAICAWHAAGLGTTAQAIIAPRAIGGKRPRSAKMTMVSGSLERLMRREYSLPANDCFGSLADIIFFAIDVCFPLHSGRGAATLIRVQEEK